jgi:hypothetical protein
MKRLLDSLANSRPPPIPARLATLISNGFAAQEGCYFLTDLYKLKGNTSRSSFADETGYEYYVNHIHIDRRGALLGSRHPWLLSELETKG